MLEYQASDVREGGISLPDSILHFESAKSIAESEPEEPDYVVRQLLIRGAITSFSAKIKAGKTTLLGHMIHGIVTGHDVVEQPTTPAKVLYCTEEGRKTFNAFLHRTGLEEREDVEALFLGKVPRELPWSAVVKDVLGHALGINADVVIFDTLTRWARIPADKENDPGTAAEAMEPLEIIRGANLAVMAVFHDRKSGGEVGESQRGSSAFGGAADILLQLVNPFTNGHPNRRILHQLGRFDDPATWHMDWHGSEKRYEVVGEGEAQTVERAGLKTGIIQALMLGDTMTGGEMAGLLRVDPANGTLTRALNELVRAGDLVKTGAGHRGNPYRFARANSFSPSLLPPVQ